MERRAEYIRRLRTLEMKDVEVTEISFFEAEREPISAEGFKMFDIPPRCQVSATLRPTEESDIKIVVGLPLEGWNGCYLGTGNGGSAGSIVMHSVLSGVARGFATANTDMGSEPDANELIGKPERWVDFGHRATHLMTVVAKQIIRAFYQREIRYSYFVGGSTGGNQALMEAQRYHEDYDGIVAFCPAYNRVGRHQAFPWDLTATCADPDSRFSPMQIAALSQRVMALYAEKSGGAPGDPFLSYPGKVEFTPDMVDVVFGDLGLNESQKNTLKMLYSAPNIPGTQEQMFWPIPLGCEGSALMIPYMEQGFSMLLGFLQRWAFGKDVDCCHFDYNEGYPKMVELFRKVMDATNLDLQAFKARGGKLILITGSADSLIPYTDGKDYYEKVVQFQGGLENTLDFFRYFNVPGLAHCSGGPGLQEIGSNLGMRCVSLDAEHDVLEALRLWVEQSKAPEKLLPVAFEDGDVKKDVLYERPVWPYPYETEYIGGDRMNPSSFRKKLGNGIY